MTWKHFGLGRRWNNFKHHHVRKVIALITKIKENHTSTMETIKSINSMSDKIGHDSNGNRCSLTIVG